MRDFQLGTEPLRMEIDGSVLFALDPSLFDAESLRAMSELLANLSAISDCKEFYEVASCNCKADGLDTEFIDALGCYLCGAPSFKRGFLYMPYSTPQCSCFAVVNYCACRKTMVIPKQGMDKLLGMFKFF